MAAGFVVLLIVVGALALAAWPVCVLMARRANDRDAHARQDSLRAGWGRREQAEAEYPRGTVVGGVHVGGGRSVGPRRDEEVIPLQDEGIIPGQGGAVDTPTPQSRR